ncbi:MAG: class I SAM-dependent methyltransferase [Acidimicrobiia bacterium]|nr:class I SAM-dependent methyltransferase [Acidimicrobiia bacterium]
MVETTARRSPKQAAFWYGGKALHAIYRSKVPALSPWARSKLSGRSYARDLVPVPELTDTFGAALDWLVAARSGRVEGAYLEFGVCTGSSMIALHDALAGRDDVALDFIGFDSFEGLPDDAPEQDDGVWKAGSFMSDRDRTERRLQGHGIDASLVVGWFSDTLNDDTRSALGLGPAPLIMVDCDIYSAAAEALAFCVPHITGPTVIVFDDWHSCGLAEKGLGEAKAWRELTEQHPSIVEVEEFPPYNPNSRIIGVATR